MHGVLLESSPASWQSFYGESRSATAREVFLSNAEPGSFQAVVGESTGVHCSGMEKESVDKLEQGGCKQPFFTLNSMQLQPPVPVDTASSSAYHNGASLQTVQDSADVSNVSCYVLHTFPCLSLFLLYNFKNV